MNKIKLICLPYAGGSSSVYLKWKRYLHKSIDLYAVELAGRGSRYNKPLYNNINNAVEDVYDMINKYIEKSSYAIFGHSMGSLIAYELTQKIMDLGYQEPIHLFLSGRKAPHIKDDKILYNLPYEDFKTEIIKLGGTPRELFEHKELLNIFIPLLRSDYKLIETYNHKRRNNKITCDITIFNGKSDDTTIEDMIGWREYSDGGFNIYNIQGGHFFINDNVEEVVDIVNRVLTGKEYQCR